VAFAIAIEQTMEFAIPVTCYLSGRFTLYKGHSQWDTNTYRNWKIKLNYENCVVAHNLSRISLTSTTI